MLPEWHPCALRDAPGSRSQQNWASVGAPRNEPVLACPKTSVAQPLQLLDLQGSQTLQSNRPKTDDSWATVRLAVWRSFYRPSRGEDRQRWLDCVPVPISLVMLLKLARTNVARMAFPWAERSLAPVLQLIKDTLEVAPITNWRRVTSNLTRPASRQVRADCRTRDPSQFCNFAQLELTPLFTPVRSSVLPRNGRVLNI